MKTKEFETSNQRHEYIYNNNLIHIPKKTWVELGKSYRADFFELIKCVPVIHRKEFKELMIKFGVKIDCENVTSSHMFVIFDEGGHFIDTKTWETTNCRYTITIWFDEVGNEKIQLFVYQEKLVAPVSYVVENFYHIK